MKGVMLLALLACLVFVAPAALAEYGCFTCEEEVSASPGAWNRARCRQVLNNQSGNGTQCTVRTQTTGGVEYQSCRMSGGGCFYIEVWSTTIPTEPRAESRRSPAKKVARDY